MLPIPHVLLFVPITVFALLFVIAAALEAGNFALRPRPRAAPRMSAQIIAFRPRESSLRSLERDALI